jgi:hypothetical protein
MSDPMNPMAREEDYFIETREPRRPRQASEQDALDVEYFQHKLFASLRLPKEYLGNDR